MVRRTRVKLSTIAERLGVSTATVSLALRDSPDVAEKTRAMVKREAANLGYIPNRRAASLRTQRSGIVGLVVRDVINPFYGEILRAVEEELDREKRTFVLSNHYDDLAKQSQFVETLLQLGADGVIMSPAIGTRPEQLQLATRNGMPVVLVARSVAGSGVPTFRGDDAHGISLATRHLVALGHERIAMVGGTDATSTGRDRYRGYVEALEHAGIKADPQLRLPGPRTKREGFEMATEFLSLRQRPTAAVCWNDLTAIGLMNGIARAGLVPGEDVSVTGYDDLEEAEIATPSLTTVWNGQHEVGRLAARALVAAMAPQGEGTQVAAPRPAGEVTLVRPELRIRDSTRRVRR